MAWVNGVWEQEDPAFQLGGMGVYPRQAVSPGDVWQRMMATSPWGMNPLSRRAAEAARPIMESQYNIQQPGIMMPEAMTGANPYGAFMRGQLYGMQAPDPTKAADAASAGALVAGNQPVGTNLPGRLPGMLGGADLMKRLRRIAALTTPTEGQMATPKNPLDIALQETYADPQMQLQAAMLPAMMQAAPAARGSLQRGFERLFNQFMEKDPAGNFLSQMVGENTKFGGLYQGASPWSQPSVQRTRTGGTPFEPTGIRNWGDAAQAFKDTPTQTGGFGAIDPQSMSSLQNSINTAQGPDKASFAADLSTSNNGDLGMAYLSTDTGRISVNSGQHSPETYEALMRVKTDLANGEIDADEAPGMYRDILERAVPTTMEWVLIGQQMVLATDYEKLRSGETNMDQIPVISPSEWDRIQNSSKFNATARWRQSPGGQYQSITIPKNLLPKALMAYQKGS